MQPIYFIKFVLLSYNPIIFIKKTTIYILNNYLCYNNNAYIYLKKLYIKICNFNCKITIIDTIVY